MFPHTQPGEISILKALRQSGFTLMELTVVLVIVALLLGGLLMPLSAQRDGEAIRGTTKSLGDVNDVLLGYAVSNGRLPCPASSSSNGLESFCSNPNPSMACGVATTTVQTLGRCSNPSDGYVPASTLGLTPVDSSGFMLDAWNNRIRYAVSFIPDPDTSGATTRYIFTGAQGMKSRTLSSLSGDHLRVCPDAACAMPLTTQAVAMVWSNGKNAGTGGSGADEIENPNPNSGTYPDPTANKFVSHLPTGSGVTGGEFDDIVQWLSPGILYNRMIVAGQLP